jgi:hypothetical protein
MILKSNVTDVVGQYESALGVFNKAKRKLTKAIETAKTVQQRKLDEADKLREEVTEVRRKAHDKAFELDIKAMQNEADVKLLDGQINRMHKAILNIDALVGGK